MGAEKKFEKLRFLARKFKFLDKLSQCVKMAKKKFSDEKTQITSVRQQPANFDSFERRPSKSFVCRLFLSTFAIRVIHLAFVVSYFPLLVWLLPPSTFYYTLFEKSPKKFHFEFSRQKTPKININFLNFRVKNLKCSNWYIWTLYLTNV